MTEREPYEPPDVRRARRLAEAKAARHSPERLAMVAEMQRRKAEAEAQARAEAPAARSRSGSTRRPASKVSRPPAEPQVFGHPVAEWTSLRDAAERRLAEVAGERRTTDGTELWSDLGAATGITLGDPRFKLPRLLTDVAAHGYETHGVLPSALVVESARTGPGRRFFAHALELGVLGDLFLPPGEEFRLTDGLEAWWLSQVEAVYARFAS